jgi:glycerol-3-phosphate cytidylyltransferase
VLTDKAIVEGGKPSPVLSFAERIEIVSSIKYVDVAVCQDTYSPLENCKAIKPDILFESSSHKEMPANNFMKSIGGRVVILPYFADQSSTKIKENIKDVKTMGVADNSA